ncbi:molybdate ABC transporter substrate-binding protein [Pelagicoccus albus]|uniref:Molybdate ABC transporter substrate-binding protein n=1 Tax=Pelagicoccus albus TaxID=415222 RepID=A0A7X1B6Y2_9BACT|nr:molybdate ABC transporter substrate-binding protein [Pelagicoccus albus]MBC2606792.1 molybdate ABC transporter substrate-binding protein [Pelagicoccus albus]
MIRRIATVFLPILLTGFVAAKSEIRIGVAANFHQTLDTLAKKYEATHPDLDITLVPGSSGKLFAQISHGAAFDAFFSADSARPERLESEGKSIPNSRFTYALGKLTLWQPGSATPDLNKAKTLALANPELAPYGRAALEVLIALDIPDDHPKRVLGSNVAHAFNFAQSGAADTAFVAASQLLQISADPAGYEFVDPSLYSPIEQQAVAITDGPEIQGFLAYCKSPQAAKIIVASGYFPHP